MKFTSRDGCVAIVLVSENRLSSQGASKSGLMMHFNGSRCFYPCLEQIALSCARGKRFSSVKTLDSTRQNANANTKSALVWGAFAILLSTFTTTLAGEDSVRDATTDAKGIEFFEQRIRPVLIARCYKCHSETSKEVQGGFRLDDRQAIRTGGDSGPGVVPGKTDEGYLLETLEYTGELYDMPPDGKLPEKVIADFRRWVKMGAPDPREPKATSTATTLATSAASPDDLWVLQPLLRPEVPVIKNKEWIRGDIDNFVMAKLERLKLTPVSPADRYTLLRRVTFDLTGLPPTANEIESFVKDSEDDAFEKVVDRLLASPAFGDRWARHWLDLTCFADLADDQGNVLIQGAWRYRDYVIDSLNHDKPFDQFIHEQIAGDLLPHDTAEQQREQIIATGYLAIGPWTLQNYVKEQLHADVVDHQVDKISRTFLGMSVRCARCHDHKFDPIPTRDYYAMAGIFHSTLTTRFDGRGVWSRIVTRELPEIQEDQALAELERSLAQVKQQKNDLELELNDLLSEQATEKFREKVVSKTGNGLTLKAGIAANQAGKDYRISFAAGPSVWAAASQATWKQDGILIQVLRKDETVLDYHVHQPGTWSDNLDAQQLSEGAFSYTGDGSGDVRLHITASRLHSGRFGGSIDDLEVIETETSQVLFTENFDEYQIKGIPGVQHHTQLPVYAAGTFPNWIGNGINHSHAVNISDVPDQPNIALQIFSGNAEPSEIPRVAEINNEIELIAKKIKLLEYVRPGITKALAVQDIPAPEDTSVYIRGNFRTRGDVVPRGALSAVEDHPFPEIPPGTSGRKELAEWLTSKKNLVTPRVLANRIWSHLFGTGLVRSVDYVGIHGDQPSHPELLDYLAIRFRDEHHWSLKSQIRELVLSSTYQMSSQHNPVAAKNDPDNRWLWRMNRRRLTAESIRDGMQAISGKLDDARGGPSLGLRIHENLSGIDDTVNPVAYTSHKSPAHIVNRRSVYLPLRRDRPTGMLEILSVFDFPHPNEITGQRVEKTVATQALFLMNAPFVKEQAKLTAERLFVQEGETLRAITAQGELRLRELYLLLLNRPAEDAEVQRAVHFVNQYEKNRAASLNSTDNIRLEAWSEFCLALFASNDFLFKE